jgi:hypothetical protein
MAKQVQPVRWSASGHGRGGLIRSRSDGDEMDRAGHTGTVDVTADLDAPCSAEELFVWVEDLARYPRWLEIVPRAEAAEPHPDDEGPAWQVDLRGRFGPLARSKRLRMVRTALDAPAAVSFERREHDGRDHSPWILRAELAPAPALADGTRLTMHLHYGGSLWGPVVERLLGDEIARSRTRLLDLLGAADATP